MGFERLRGVHCNTNSHFPRRFDSRRCPISFSESVLRTAAARDNFGAARGGPQICVVGMRAGAARVVRVRAGVVRVVRILLIGEGRSGCVGETKKWNW